MPNKVRRIAGFNNFSPLKQAFLLIKNMRLLITTADLPQKSALRAQNQSIFSTGIAILLTYPSFH